MTFLTYDIPVQGGELRVADWRPGAPDAPVVVALHGMTGSHLSWSFLAEQLPGVRLIAPDMRGRGRSAGLPGPFGVASHVEDLRAVLRTLGVTSAVVLGHSMGAFVAAAALKAEPEVFTRGMLLDGGLPVTVQLQLDDEDLVEAVLGQAGRRLRVAFSSLESNRRFWRMHPAFAGVWNETLAAFADYDVEERLGENGEIEFRPVASREAITADSRELYGSSRFRAALCTLTQPMTLLTAPRGLLNDAPGVYSERERARWQAELPTLRMVEVAGVNHYTLVLSPRGARAIAVELVRSGAVPASALDTPSMADTERLTQ